MAMARPPRDNSEQVNLELAESAQTMASTDFWKLLVQAMANSEDNCLVDLDNYLSDEAHPDREEVMTLLLKWHARRHYRRLLLGNVRDYKTLIVPEVLSEEAQRILAEYEE